MRRAARPLLYAGIVAIVFGLGKVHAAWIADPGYDFTGSSRFAWTIAYAGILLLTTYGSGLPDHVRTRRGWSIAALGAAGASALVMSVVQFLYGDALLPRFVVFAAAGAVVPWSLLCAAIARGGWTRGEGQDRVLLVAEATEAALLRDELGFNPERPFSLLNHLTPAETHPRGPQSRPLVELVLDLRANLVIVDRIGMLDPVVVSQAGSLHENGVRVRTLSQFYDEWLGKLPMSELERASLFFDISEVHGARYVRFKRLADVVMGVAACVVLAVVTLPVVAGNLVANRGPLLYRQARVGKNGRVFTIWKFRTMRPEAATSEAAGSWTQLDDPRVTPFGRILRATHLDELPQAVNILRGDLSIVGPRPEQPHYVEELAAKLAFYDLRHLVRPGLTGWAQVKYGYAGDEQDTLEKLQYDMWYLSHQSLSLDLRIIGRTIRSTISGSGRGR